MNAASARGNTVNLKRGNQVSEYIKPLWTEKIMKSIEKVTARFLWFAAGAFFGYLWMARAYGLF